MSLKLKELSKKEELLTGGHRMCAGCGAPTIVRQILAASEKPLVAANATGCLEVSTSIFPYTAWKIPWMHSAFENAAATISGIEAMYKSLKRQGKLDREMKFIAFGGDGGTYDIGFQSLSGAMERGHDIVYVCYDNGAYMNTGIQRSSATPLGANTTTSPAGSVIPGKTQARKNLTKIMVAHNIPYVAQASPSNWRDLMSKARKAINVDGPAFLNVIAPCNRGWRTPTNNAIELCKLAIDSCYWPIYEYENGKLTVNYKPKEKIPVVEFLKGQGRFKHLFSPENEGILKQIQADVDREWDSLLKEESFHESDKS
ncbi:MAG: pyruvate ferredoxin oxidoreductase [Nitrospirota bacterium]|nr:MAG: pyruvate ferredoxin oxidoreductase [Nitrospirota bacterium]